LTFILFWWGAKPLRGRICVVQNYMRREQTHPKQYRLPFNHV
jgi:hypothetical protein